MAKKGARWFWRSDTDWVEYDAATQEKLEEAFRKGEDEYKVDKERFVDFKNMLQRRFDDRMKRRGVKREIPKIFEKELILLLFKTKKKIKEMSELVGEHGGLAASDMNKKVTLIVASEDEKFTAYTDEMNEATKYGIPVVKEQYIKDCILHAELLPPKDYIIYNTKKRKASSSDSDSDSDTTRPPAKRAKTADVPAVAATATTAPATATAAPAATTTVSAPASAGLTKQGSGPVGDATQVKAPTSWMGVTTQPGFSPFPFSMNLTKRDPSDGSLAGYMVWPTLSNTKTRIRGKVNAATGEVTWEEYEVVKGDEVEVPNTYSGVARGNVIEGKFRDSHGDEGVFKLDLLVQDDDSDDDNPDDPLKPKSVWPGFVRSPFKFEMVIEKRKGNKMEGILRWPTLNDSITKFRGTIDGFDVVFEEYEVVKGHDEVQVPNNYEGKLLKRTDGSYVVQGKYVDAYMVQGDFEFELKSS